MSAQTLPDDRAALEAALKLARRSLAILETQAAGYTALTRPAHLQIELEEKRAEVATLEARLAGSPAAPSAETRAAPPPDRPLSRLHRNLVDTFSDEELRTLCFDLDVDYESLGGQGKSGKARELVELMRRTGRLGELVAACRTWRPNLTWDDVG